MRNTEKDEAEMAARRELMLETGFRVFAEKGIEAVSMQDVARACDLGIATLYRYFKTKLEFVIAIGARQWEEYFREVETEYARRGGELMNAAEELDFYLSMYILLYRGHRNLLCFNQNFNGYVAHEQAAPELLSEYLQAIEPFTKKFHTLYEKGLRDGSIRTDEPEQTMFTTTMHIMLAVCGRFAQGVVYHGENIDDLTQELMILKRMILNSYAKPS
jgi:AcrR family transcriptional regulator